MHETMTGIGCLSVTQDSGYYRRWDLSEGGGDGWLPLTLHGHGSLEPPDISSIACLCCMPFPTNLAARLLCYRGHSYVSRHQSHRWHWRSYHIGPHAYCNSSWLFVTKPPVAERRAGLGLVPARSMSTPEAFLFLVSSKSETPHDWLLRCDLSRLWEPEPHAGRGCAE